MKENNDSNQNSYLARVMAHDSTRRGIAAAAAGVIVGALCEALWPTS